MKGKMIKTWQDAIVLAYVLLLDGAIPEKSLFALVRNALDYFDEDRFHAFLKEASREGYLAVADDFVMATEKLKHDDEVMKLILSAVSFGLSIVRDEFEDWEEIKGLNG